MSHLGLVLLTLDFSHKAHKVARLPERRRDDIQQVVQARPLVHLGIDYHLRAASPISVHHQHRDNGFIKRPATALSLVTRNRKRTHEFKRLPNNNSGG
eukprot:7994769-Pyramimonas_sp.AAC.2